MVVQLLMGVSGGDWLPLLFIMIALMAAYNGIEWLVDHIEHSIRRRQDAHVKY